MRAALLLLLLAAGVGCNADPGEIEQTVGYREIFEFLDGRHPDLATTAELIRQNTRHYAKRQETWFKKESDLTWFDAQKDMDKILPFLESRIL